MCSPGAAALTVHSFPPVPLSGRVLCVLRADCARQEPAGCLFCKLQGDCIQSDAGQSVMWLIFSWLRLNWPSGLQEPTVCVGVDLLTHFIVHLLAPQGWMFPICGSRTLMVTVLRCRYNYHKYIGAVVCFELSEYWFIVVLNWSTIELHDVMEQLEKIEGVENR